MNYAKRAGIGEAGKPAEAILRAGTGASGPPKVRGVDFVAEDLRVCR